MQTPSRREIAFGVAIISGILIGKLIKKVTIGMFIGLILGIAAAVLMAGRSNEKNDMQLLPDEKPPFFKSWNAWYILVIGFLLLLIILFYFFTKHFS